MRESPLRRRCRLAARQSWGPAGHCSQIGGGRPRVWLGVRRILAIYRVPGVLQDAIHLHQIGRGIAIWLGERGERRGVGLILQQPVHCPLVRGPGLLRPGAPLVEAVFVLCPSVARTLPARAVRRRRSVASGASRWCEPSNSRLAYSGPSVRSLPRLRRSATHACGTARGIAPVPCAGRSSQRRTSRRGPWAAWIRARGQLSGPPVSRRCVG